MTAFEINNPSVSKILPRPPSEAMISLGDNPGLRLWLGEGAVAWGAEGSLRLMLALNFQTGSALAWSLFEQPAEIVDAARTLAEACVEAGAAKGSRVSVVSELNLPRPELSRALRLVSGVRTTVVGSSGRGSGMQSTAAEIRALVTSAVKFELAQASANDGPLSMVALRHLIDQVVYWYNRRHRPGASPHQGAIQ